MKIKKLLGFFFLIITIQSITIKNQKIYDQQGRQIYFHGTNVIVKTPPYIPKLDAFDPQFSFSEQDMANCQKWGFNVIRLGVMWAGVQPEKDTYNQTYLQKMKQLVTTAGQKYGIYTVIDFHQDILAEKFCGDGVPTWLIDQLKGYRNFPYPVLKNKIELNSSGLPDWKDCTDHNWGLYYLSYDVGRQFRNLYTIGHHLNIKFTNYWEKLAEAFKGNKWPFVGNALKQPYLLLPSVAERVYLQRFYDELTQKIRKIDNQTPICFEPITFDQSVPIGFSHPPGGFSQKDKSILCYHYYSPPARSLNTIDARVKDAKRLQVVSILDQFSMTDDFDVFDRAQKYQQSWISWLYKNYGKRFGASYDRYVKPYLNQQNLGSGMYDDSGNIDANFVKKLSRTYFQNVAGKLLHSHYSNQTSQFFGTYEATPNKVTRLYFNEQYNYVNGVNIQIHPSSLNIKVVKKDFIFEITSLENSSTLIMVIITNSRE